MSQYNFDLRVGEFCIAKQKLRYLNKTINLKIIWRLNFTKHREKYGLIEIMHYINNSYTGSLKDRKSIIEYCFFLGKKVVN